MDWIQWYYAMLLVLGTCASLYMHGNRRSGYHDFRVDFITICLSIPIMGRMFGWW